MLTGWLHTVDKKWYFMDNTKTNEEGNMAIGWKQIDGSWYYFALDGTMMVNFTTPDGYKVGADGRLVS